ncbi:MAG: hypothetical protein KHZ58_12550 [Hungatella hathewayi]|nr:hypothetical protein [Hungatella hathewayi]
MGSAWVIVVFVLSLALLLIGIIRYKMNAGVMMLISSIVAGILLNMPFDTLVSTVTTGFGNMMASLGIVVGLGSILGGILNESGATDQLAYGMLKKIGSKKATLALNATGFAVSIPVFMGPAYIVLNPLCKTIAKFTKKNVIGYTTALVVGLMVTHCLVIPTPGPLAVAGSVGINLGWFILYALIISVPASLVGGWLFGEKLLNKLSDNTGSESVQNDDEILETIEKDMPKNHPSMGNALFLIVLPIALILIATILPSMIKNDGVANVCALLTKGNGVVSLLISVMVAWLMLRKYISRTPGKIFGESLNEVGDIFMILGASGSFGAIIGASGIDQLIIGLVDNFNIPLLVMAFMLCCLLKAALGSSATALVTSASIIGPVVISMGVNGVLISLAICLGGLFMPLPTDGAFWQVKEYNDLSMKETFYSYTLGCTIACITGFIGVLILSFFAGVLPGLH